MRSRQPSPPLAAEKPLFYSDRKADDLNVKYGGLHRGDIPRYRRSGGELVLLALKARRKLTLTCLDSWASRRLE